MSFTLRLYGGNPAGIYSANESVIVLGEVAATQWISVESLLYQRALAIAAQQTVRPYDVTALADYTVSEVSVEEPVEGDFVIPMLPLLSLDDSTHDSTAPAA